MQLASELIREPKRNILKHFLFGAKSVVSANCLSILATRLPPVAKVQDESAKVLALLADLDTRHAEMLTLLALLETHVCRSTSPASGSGCQE